MKVNLKDGKEINIEFNKEDILKSINNIKYIDFEHKVRYANYDSEFLSEEEMYDSIQYAIKKVEQIDEESITEIVQSMPLKKNGWLKQRTIRSIHDIDICDYVTDFTNCWYYDHIYIRVESENRCSIGFKRTQQTTN